MQQQVWVLGVDRKMLAAFGGWFGQVSRHANVRLKAIFLYHAG